MPIADIINQFNEELGDDDILEDLFLSPSILFGENDVTNDKK